MENLEFREAVPDDAELAVPLIMESGPEAFSFVFDNGKQSATEFLLYAFQNRGGEFSFDNHYVLVNDDLIIGTTAIYSAKKARFFIFKEVLNIFSVYGFRAFSVMNRGLKIENVLLLPKGNEFYIGHVAISKEHRAKGYGEYMLKALMKTTRKDRKGEFVLDVSDENLRAKVLYLRLGFKDQRFVPSKLKSEYGRVPNHFRMVKEM